MFLSLFVVCLCLATTISGNCNVSITADGGELKEPQPLILTESGKDFIYPVNESPRFVIKSRDSILIACPGEGNKINNTDVKQLTAKCGKDANFTVNGESRKFSTITCIKNPKVTVNVLKKKCLETKTSMNIGFQLEKTFLQVIQVCRDKDTYETYYTKSYLSSKSCQRQINKYNVTWQKGDYFTGMEVDELYNYKTQNFVLEKILRRKNLVTKTVRLSRGHLTPKGDFNYHSQQNATFQYLNADPQWLSFNRGNWENLESSIRNFAANNSLDLEVYTGVYGKMTMTDSRDIQQVITIGCYRSKSMLLPRFFWKVIYHPLTKKGTAFVGLNDPFITTAPRNAFLCENRIDRNITWLSWAKNYTEGFSYACTVGELSAKIPTIPQLDVEGILL